MMHDPSNSCFSAYDLVYRYPVMTVFPFAIDTTMHMSLSSDV